MGPVYHARIRNARGARVVVFYVYADGEDKPGASSRRHDASATQTEAQDQSEAQGEEGEIDYPDVFFLNGEPAGSHPPSRSIDPLPGRVAIRMDRSEKIGSIYLPTSGRMNPDTATVIASGVDGLEAGDRVGVTPNQWGLMIDEDDGSEIRIFGINERIPDCLPFKIIDGEVAPHTDWILAKRHESSAKIMSRRKYDSGVGTVVMDPSGEMEPGETLYFVEGVGNVYSFKYGDEPEDLILVRRSRCLMTASA